MGNFFVREVSVKSIRLRDRYRRKSTIPVFPPSQKTTSGEQLCVQKKAIVFSRGDPADAVFQILEGRIRLAITSKNGKEATVALLGPGDFLGEEVIRTPGLPRRNTAIALVESKLLRHERNDMLRMLNRDPAFCHDFLNFLLARNARIQDDFADRIFNPAEKRLARVLLLLGTNGKNGHSSFSVPRISQEVIATMIGATRPRVNMLMNRLRRLGVIRYGRELQVNGSMLSGLLLD